MRPEDTKAALTLWEVQAAIHRERVAALKQICFLLKMPPNSAKIQIITEYDDGLVLVADIVHAPVEMAERVEHEKSGNVG